MSRKSSVDLHSNASKHAKSEPIEELRNDAPCIVLMGMRGAGKTTLGRLAAEHLNAPFIDADELFSQKHKATPKEYVAEHGWTAFRKEETCILDDLLKDMHDATRKNPLVISLGGGVVEEQTNRDMIKSCWSADGRMDRGKRIAVIHVFREVDKVLLDQRGLPSWTGVSSGDEVWNRRRPWFRESSSHEFVNFTDGDVLQHASDAESSRAARLRFEAVERDFVRFLHALLASYEPKAQPWLPSRSARSYLVTLPFADLRPHVEKLPLITLGADAIELRADLLHDPTKGSVTNGAPSHIVEAYENPSLSYLSEQIALIRRHLPGYPLVFTLRTPAQGGRYPYPADAPTEALFTSLRHALKLGCDVIDIEMGLDDVQTRTLIQEAKERRIAVLISWRDKVSSTQGGFAWQSTRARELYEEAVGMGADVVKIVGTAGQVADDFALRVFAADLNVDHDATCLPPLSAYNMGYAGRISRFLNPTLASITHSLAKELSKRGVVGNPSMTFEEIQQALHLSGFIEKASFVAINCGALTVSLHGYMRWFKTMGLPYSIRADEWPVDGIAKMLRDNDPRQGDVRGVFFGGEGAAVADLERWGDVDVTLDNNVTRSGFADCALVETRHAATDGTGTPLRTFLLRTANKIVEALAELITSSISPSVHLNRQSVCVVLHDEPLSRNELSHLMSVQSAVQAARTVGLEVVTRHDKLTRWNAKLGDPTVIINCCEDTTLHTSLLNSPAGGLYIDMHRNEQALACIRQPCYAEVGWRCIEVDKVWRHVHALRFRAFTGRRAPSELADVWTRSGV